jgi:hypothetical protein
VRRPVPIRLDTTKSAFALSLSLKIDASQGSHNMLARAPGGK